MKHHRFARHNPGALLFAILITVLHIHSATAFAKEASPAQCRHYQEKIDYYDALRRGGGNAKRMETWRQKRQRYKDKYWDNNCRRSPASTNPN